MEPWHFDYFLSKEEADSLSGRALGRTLVAPDQKPLGFCGVYFDENGAGQAVVIAFFYGGPNGYFMRKYLPLVMRGMTEVIEILIGMGIETIYAVADSRVPEADRFLMWLGGSPIGEDDPSGPLYAIYLPDVPAIKRKFTKE